MDVDPGPERKAVVCALLAATGGIRSRCALQDVVFVGQEFRLLPEQLFSFPVWPGIGTARYSLDLERVLDELLREGTVMDTGGACTLKLLAPREAHPLGGVPELARFLSEAGELRLSLLAAYRMARLAEAREDPRGREEQSLRMQAQVRLGWPQDLVDVADASERLLKALAPGEPGECH
jgi:hypothetical protein